MPARSPKVERKRKATMSTVKFPPGTIVGKGSHSKHILGSTKSFHIIDEMSLALLSFLIRAFAEIVWSCLPKANELCLIEIFD